MTIQTFDDTEDYGYEESAASPTLAQYDDLLRQNARLNRDIRKLSRYIDDISQNVDALNHSVAWKIGFKTVSLMKKLKGGSIGKTAFDNINDTLEIFHHWKKTRD